MMNGINWKRVEVFVLDSLVDNYGFSICLVDENDWLIIFIKCVILEYKKFMFLVVMVDWMVFFLEIVDIVWY